MLRRVICGVLKMERNDALYARYQNALENAEMGKVVTRFPPEPSGYLHIGHVKAAMLNYHYAKIYQGTMILRFDDTNPAKESQEFVDNIKADLQRLEIHPDRETRTSDYFPLIFDYMQKLIEDGKAYLDNTPVEIMRNQRNEGIASEHRSKTPEQNLELWKDFKLGKLPEYCVRAKIDMQEKNKCLRDPVFYRYNDTPHHITGSTYKVYPTYDFACPIVDSIEGVTHCLRTSEYNDRNAMYVWVQDALGLRRVYIYDIARLAFVNTCLSKRRLQKLVDTGVVEGWFDPRFPTVQGILRRGMVVQTLKEFMLDQGPSRNTVLMDWTIIWAKNKQILDPVAPRYTAISAESPCLLEVVNGPGSPEEQVHPLHPKNAEVGTDPVIFYNKVLLEYQDASTVQLGEKITLMKWGNVTIDAIEENTSGESFQGVPFKLLLKGRVDLDDKDFKKTKKFTWLAAVEDVSKVDLVEYDVLITKEKLEEFDDFDRYVNANSKFDTLGWASPAVKHLEPGSFTQFERKGYYRIDKQEERAICVCIPDGSSKNTGQKVDPKKLAKGTAEPKVSKRQLKKQQAEAKKKPAEAAASEETKKED